MTKQTFISARKLMRIVTESSMTKEGWYISEIRLTFNFNYNKEASWLYAELKSHISFQMSFVAYLKLSNET